MIKKIILIINDQTPVSVQYLQHVKWLMQSHNTSLVVRVCCISKHLKDSFSVACTNCLLFLLSVSNMRVSPWCWIGLSPSHDLRPQQEFCFMETHSEHYVQCENNINKVVMALETDYVPTTSLETPAWLPPTRTRAGRSVWSKKWPWTVSRVPPMTLPVEGDTPVTSE